MLQAIIFDFDGVIVDSEPLHFRATQSVLHSIGAAINFETYLQECVGQPDVENFRRLCVKHQLNADEQSVKKLVDAKINEYRQLASARARAYPGVTSLIKSAAQHYPLAICSGSFKNEIQQILATIDDEDLAPYFQSLVSIEDVPAGKPDPAGYRLAAKHLNALPEFCLAIEDSPAGIIAAKTAGMTVLALTTTHSREKLTLADHCIDSLANITLADLNQLCYSQSA
jgi:HAD superfamily hydrolase (TIGR01509 family)